MSVLNEDGTIDKMTFNMTPEEFENKYANPSVEKDYWHVCKRNWKNFDKI